MSKNQEEDPSAEVYMCQHNTTTSLGFSEKKVPVGLHICQIYSDRAERDDSLLKFLLSGLQSDERSACFFENFDEQILREFFESHGINYDKKVEEEAILFAKAKEIYLQDNSFDPDRMITILENYHEEAVANGFSAARAIGEMSPEIQNTHGGDRLLEYESKVSMLLKTHPVTSVCQYNAKSFDGATIMDILKVHPQMIVRGSLVQNPFFIPPEEFLKDYK